MRLPQWILRSLAAAWAITWCGCGGAGPDEYFDEGYTAAPAWLVFRCDEYWGDVVGERICAIGEAKIGDDLSGARTKAAARARAEIGRMLEARIENMVEEFRAQQADGEFETLSESYSSTITRLATETPSAVSQLEDYVSSAGRIYVLVSLEAEVFASSLAENETIPGTLRSFMRARAGTYFAERPDELE